MKRGIIAVLGLTLLAPAGVVKAEMEMQHHEHMQTQHTGEYCEKHCRTSDLRKEVTTLEAQITKDKTAHPTGSGKLVEMQAQAKAAREHIAKHEKELADVKAELEKAEAELKAMEGK